VAVFPGYGPDERRCASILQTPLTQADLRIVHQAAPLDRVSLLGQAKRLHLRVIGDRLGPLYQVELTPDPDEKSSAGSRDEVLGLKLRRIGRDNKLGPMPIVDHSIDLTWSTL